MGTGKPISFEAFKLALKQDRNGHVLTLVIHPNETPDELWRTPAGQRYGVALVQLDEEEAAFEDGQDGERAMKMLGARARDARFQRWVLREAGPVASHLMGEPERRARDAVKHILAIASSTEIRDNPEVRGKFMELMQKYDKYKSEAQRSG